jgi:ketosteroid isomerase-like protein
MATGVLNENDIKLLSRLNSEYVQAVDQKDVAWFDRHLSADFLNTNPDGSLVDRTAFLRQVGRGAGVSGIKESDVRIRVLGDVAIIHARTSYQLASGATASGRYTDIWLRRGERWECVAAHVTRG